jgi:hypothetical protein
MQFIYLLISLYFGRKNPLFFLIFPLALIQGPGAFIDTRTVLVAPEFFLVGRNIMKDLTIFYLIIVVFYLKKKVNFRILKESPMKLYLAYILFLIFMTIAISGTKYEAIAIIRLWLYMVLGYFLMILLFSSVNIELFFRFLTVLFWTNGIQSVLYILNSSGILPVFDQSFFYSEIESGSGTFLRDFNTIPNFSNFLFILGITSLLLTEERINRKAIYFTLATYPVVLLFTFTRSLLISSVIQLILVLLVILWYRPSVIFKSYVFVLITCGLFLFIFIKSSFVNEFNYFDERFSGVVEEGVKEGNVDIRIQYHEKAWALLANNNSLILGDGLNKRLNNNMGDIGAWSADSSIPFLLLYTGLLGTLLFFGNMIFFLLLSMRTNFYSLNPLAITLFASFSTSIISFFLMGGNAWGSPLIFFDFVLIVYLRSIYNSRSELSL